MLHGVPGRPMGKPAGAAPRGEQLVPRGTFPPRVLQAGTLARATKKEIEAMCKKLGIWVTGRTRQGMEGDLGGAFALALAQHGAAGAAAAAAPAAAPAAAAAAPAATPSARARRASARLRARLALSDDDDEEEEEEEEVPREERMRIVRRSKRRRVQRVIT